MKLDDLGICNLKDVIHWEGVNIEVGMLLTGKIKMQTLHNQASLAMKEGDLKTYIEKCLVKSYFKFLNKERV